MVFGEQITVRTKGHSDIIDITDDVGAVVRKSGIKNGLVNVFVVGSTASVSTMEYEPALVQDVRDQLEKIVPSTLESRHSRTWGDDNGFSHIRATLMGPGITVPVSQGNMVLGTWQQVVVIDHDNRGRSRSIFIQVMGE
ncbi:MAG: secondary thiamine-phosphate synthase enzyme YjbQ [Chitinivibrionales bacterium]